MEWASIATLILSFVVAVSTVIYVALTWKLVNETRVIRKANSAPHVAVYLRPSENWVNIFDVVIENHGAGPAHNISFSIEQHAGFPTDKKKGHLGFLDNLNGLPYMAAGQRFQSVFGSAIDLLQKDARPVLKLALKYHDSEGDQYTSTYVLEPAKFEGLSRIGEDPAYSTAKALDKIAKSVTQVVKQSKLNVLISTERELRNENERIRDAYNKRREAASGDADDKVS